MKTLFVHIGTAKTGTTSIQHFLDDNRKALEKYGICYPPLLYKYPNNGTYKNGMFLVKRILKANDIRDYEKERELFERSMDQVGEKFKLFDTVVLSEESIWTEMFGEKADLWEQILKYAQRDGYTIKAIVYFRPQADYVDSWWNQRVKSPSANCYNKDSFEVFLKKDVWAARVEYLKGLEYIASFIGRENIIVRRFDRSAFRDGLLQSDFLSCLGLEMAEDLIISEKNTESNLRLSGNTCEIKRQINLIQDFSIPERQFLRVSLEQITPQSLQNDPSTAFSQDEADIFMKSYEEENEMIAKQYLDDNLPLFDTSYRAKGKWTKDNPYYLDDCIRLSAVSDIRLYRMIKAQNDSIKRQNEKIRESNEKMAKQMEKMQKRIRALENPGIITAFKTLMKSIKAKLKKLIKNRGGK